MNDAKISNDKNEPRPCLLEIRGVGKQFFGNPVLKDIHLKLPQGTTLGLVGENGAGKSTLMNILGGNLAADEGSLWLDGKPFQPRDPNHASECGIAFIHQELNLFANLSVAENIFLTSFPRAPFSWAPFIARSRMRENSRRLLERVGLNVSPEALVDHLSAGERQLVEIAKALSVDARVIIFDEPTTSLTEKETRRLFDLIRRLKERGIAMVYISHNLKDALSLCDEIAVLRDGALISHRPAAEWTVNEMISRMVGRSIDQLYPERKGGKGSEILLELKRVTQPGMVRDVSFRLHRGEILGIAGLMGSGRSELARIIFGLDGYREGEIRFRGETLPKLKPRHAIRMGMAFLTEDRRLEGLCMDASIAENASLASLSSHARTPLRILDHGRALQAVNDIRERVRLTSSARNEQAVRTLSGGNQQKVVFAKWMLNKPDCFILDEPTRGIDVGAKYEVYSLINDAADQGTGVLMISSEIEELLGMCDRILVMCGGEIRDRLDREAFDRERVLKAALHGADGS